jgi:hypothetical protein
MKVTRRKLKVCHAALSLALILLSAFAVPSNTMADDFAFSKIWTTVGSAGTVDESDLDKVDLLRGTVTMKPGDEPSRAVIRYNVVAVDGLFAGGDGFFMGVRFRDNGDQAQVIARLIEYDFNTGAYRTLLTFDSNAQAAAPAYQTGSAFDCRPDWRFEFGRKAYFVEATLIRTGADGNPALGIVTIGPGLC